MGRGYNALDPVIYTFILLSLSPPLLPNSFFLCSQPSVSDAPPTGRRSGGLFPADQRHLGSLHVGHFPIGRLRATGQPG